MGIYLLSPKGWYSVGTYCVTILSSKSMEVKIIFNGYRKNIIPSLTYIGPVSKVSPEDSLTV
jgi:hypothetical protein